MHGKFIFSLLGRDPSAFNYYFLHDYEDLAAQMETHKQAAKYVELDEPNYIIDNISLPRAAKRNEPWTSAGKLSMQFSQYYVTDNWYKGGEPNASLLGLFNYERNYRSGKKMWDNSADIRLGFYSSPNDTIRGFRVNNDLLKLNTTLGYQTPWQKWYYAFNAELNTQLFTNYKGTNTNTVRAAFLSPTRIFLSLGIKYDYNTNVYAFMSPAAYKLIFLANDKIADPRTVGIENGKAQNDFGFYGKGKVKWAFTKDVKINSTFDVFTPYSMENVEFNWETEGNFIINRYLSTRLALNMRFDSTPVSSDYESPKLQIQEQLSFGFNYKFH